MGAVRSNGHRVKKLDGLAAEYDRDRKRTSRDGIRRAGRSLLIANGLRQVVLELTLSGDVAIFSSTGTQCIILNIVFDILVSILRNLSADFILFYFTKKPQKKHVCSLRVDYRIAVIYEP